MGEPRAKGHLETVYMGIPMSELPAIIRYGPRPRLLVPDIKRQKIWREAHPNRKFADPQQKYMRVIYVSRRKVTAAGYPWVLHAHVPFPGYKGLVVCADGSGPWVAILQGTWIRQTERGELTARWERREQNNDQVAVSPKYVCWQWVHVYGAAAAYRPFRATGFSEDTHIPLPEAMGWPEHEWIRRLRRAE